MIGLIILCATFFSITLAHIGITPSSCLFRIGTAIATIAVSNGWFLLFYWRHDRQLIKCQFLTVPDCGNYTNIFYFVESSRECTFTVVVL